MVNENLCSVTNIKKRKIETVYKGKLSKRTKFELNIKRVFLICSIVVLMFPVFAIITASLSTGTSFMQKNIIPDSITFDNYIKAYKHAYRVFRVHLHSLYTQCCGPESDYHLGIGTFEEMAMEAFTDALEKFLDTAE